MFYIGLNLLHVQRDVDAGQAVLSFAQYSRENFLLDLRLTRMLW